MISLLLLFFTLTAIGWAQTPRQEMGRMGAGIEQRDKPCCGRGPYQKGMMGEKGIPDLTEEQNAQLEKLQVEHMKNLQPLRNELAEKKAQLHTQTATAEVNMSRINGLIEEIGKLRTEIMKEREKHHQAVRKILNEKQRLFFDNRGGHRFGMDD
jgi:Spy/CpxP family protein refolding chaperone